MKTGRRTAASKSTSGFPSFRRAWLPICALLLGAGLWGCQRQSLRRDASAEEAPIWGGTAKEQTAAEEKTQATEEIPLSVSVLKNRVAKAEKENDASLLLLASSRLREFEPSEKRWESMRQKASKSMGDRRKDPEIRAAFERRLENAAQNANRVEAEVRKDRGEKPPDPALRKQLEETLQKSREDFQLASVHATLIREEEQLLVNKLEQEPSPEYSKQLTKAEKKSRYWEGRRSSDEEKAVALGKRIDEWEAQRRSYEERKAALAAQQKEARAALLEARQDMELFKWWESRAAKEQGTGVPSTGESARDSKSAAQSVKNRAERRPAQAKAENGTPASEVPLPLRESVEPRDSLGPEKNPPAATPVPAMSETPLTVRVENRNLLKARGSTADSTGTQAHPLPQSLQTEGVRSVSSVHERGNGGGLRVKGRQTAPPPAPPNWAGRVLPSTPRAEPVAPMAVEKLSPSFPPVSVRGRSETGFRPEEYRIPPEGSRKFQTPEDSSLSGRGAPARIYRVAKGDTLPSLAEKIYGDPALWPRIYDANKYDILRGLLEPGQWLLIPQNIGRP